MVDKYGNYLILGNNFLEQDERSRAKEAFLKSLTYAKNKKEALDSLFEIADLSLQEENYREALTWFLKIIHLEDHPGAYYGLAIAREGLGEDPARIIEAYQKAIALDPHYTKAYYYLAHIYFDLEDYSRARELFLQVLTLEPEDFVAWNDLGSLYEKTKNYDQAKKAFLKSLSLSPRYSRALYNMGVIEGRLKNYQGALAYYEESLEEYSHPHTYLNMSAIYFELRDDCGALEILTRGLKDHPDSVNLHFNLACCYVHLRDKKKAARELKEAIKIKPEAEIWAETDQDLKDLIKEMHHGHY